VQPTQDAGSTFSRRGATPNQANAHDYSTLSIKEINDIIKTMHPNASPGLMVSQLFFIRVHVNEKSLHHPLSYEGWTT
jgi:hypothetical protein